MTRVMQLLLFISIMTLTGCASQTSMKEGLDRSVKAYNRMLRWHEIENAGLTYIDTDLKDDYLKQAESLKARGLSITDYRIISTKYLPENKSGDVVTEFDYYMLPSNRIKTISYQQKWFYREESKGWKLKSGLNSFE
jgi:hypothetical protein